MQHEKKNQSDTDKKRGKNSNKKIATSKGKRLSKCVPQWVKFTDVGRKCPDSVSFAEDVLRGIFEVEKSNFDNESKPNDTK